MDKTKNGTFLKVTIGTLVALLLASLVWIWNAAGICKSVEMNTETISKSVPKIDSNTIAVTSIGKDIERLDEKIDRIDVAQQQMITMQREILREVKN